MSGKHGKGQIRPSMPGSQPVAHKSQTTTQVVEQHYSGVVPHPELMEHFNRLVPNAAERFFALAEKEVAARHSNEAAALNANIESQQRQLSMAEKQTAANIIDARIGLFMGFIASLLCIGGAIYFGSKGEFAAAGMLTVLPIATVIREFRRTPGDVEPSPPDKKVK